MVPETRARKRLERWMAQDTNSRTASSVARELGIRQPSVSGWLGRTSRPESTMREAIEALTNGFVKAREWMTEDEQDAIRRVKPMTPTGSD